MDLDATVKGVAISEKAIENMVGEIVRIKVGDEVDFRIKSIAQILDDAEYGGVRVGLETVFDGVFTPLKIDISTGDAITPSEIQYEFKMMFEAGNITIWAYPLETVLAEKLETVIVRTTTNTRMRDFYDLHILLSVHGKSIDSTILADALVATMKKRGSAEMMKGAAAVLNDVAASEAMQNLWRNYQKKFGYAADISWAEVMNSVQTMSERAKLISKIR